MSGTDVTRQAIRDVRRFNRFYTKQIGLLQDHMLSSPFSLTEVRILYEIAHRRNPTASDLIEELGLDPGYLSRSLSKLEQQRLLRRERSAADGRQSFLTLTPKGQSTFPAARNSFQSAGGHDAEPTDLRAAEPVTLRHARDRRAF